MNYKQKYEEALERARTIHDAGFSTYKATMEDVFPELRESKDERIREKIIEGFWHYGDSFKTFGGLEVKDIIAWLERQSEKEINEASYKTGIKRVLDNPESYGLEKQGEQNLPNWEEELEKCKKNPLYFTKNYVRIQQKEQKPTEWSKEDENAAEKIIESIRFRWDKNTAKLLVDWFDSLIKRRIKL